MTSATLFSLCSAALVGIGLFGLLLHQDPLRRIVALNVLGAGTFLLFGAIARRGAVDGLPSDPVPQAMVITGVVVAFAGSALAVSIVRRLAALDALDGPDGPDGPDAPSSIEPSDDAPRDASARGSGDSDGEVGGKSGAGSTGVDDAPRRGVNGGAFDGRPRRSSIEPDGRASMEGR
ncbi:MAG TPA: NADH-quinone oxidoreductase subunit K [Phycisphaerales bacterium]|nr:NADH-quinone oxidoreductase subunit K [Phycisphaerales bacterium]HMP36685.1 NADH-quinone oxidoreductase subunit K [Phycisphaerales bacterium]